MRDYEVVYIFRPELEAEEVDARLEEHHQRLGGDVTAVEHWGQRELAYEIGDERRGYYVVAQFRVEPDDLPDYEQALKHDQDLLRHLLVLSEGELPTPPSQRGEDEEEEDEEDEDEEDEGEEPDEEDGEDEEDEGEEEEDDDEEDEEEDEDDADDEEEDEDGEDSGSGDDEDDDEEEEK